MYFNKINLKISRNYQVLLFAILLVVTFALVYIFVVFMQFRQQQIEKETLRRLTTTDDFQLMEDHREKDGSLFFKKLQLDKIWPNEIASHYIYKPETEKGERIKHCLSGGQFILWGKTTKNGKRIFVSNGLSIEEHFDQDVNWQDQTLKSSAR